MKKRVKIDPQMHLTIIFYFCASMSFFYLKLIGTSLGLIDNFFYPIVNFLAKLDGDTLDNIGMLSILFFFNVTAPFSYAAIFHKINTKLATFLYKFLVVYFIILILFLIKFSAVNYLL